MNNLFKNHLLLLLTLLSISSSLIADTEYEMNPSFHPHINSCGNWIGEIDLLVWRASESGVAYATETRFFTDSRGIDHFKTKVHNPDFRWDAGFRAILGYLVNCGWGYSAIWTHFHTKSHDKIRNPSFEETGTLIYPAFGTATGPSQALIPVTRTPTQISSKWALHMDIVDLALDYEFNPSACFVLKPFIGIRAAWLKQKYHIDSTIPNATMVNLHDLQNISLSTNFNGAGLLGGIGLEWDLGCGISLFGDAAISVLYGSSKSIGKEFNSFLSTPPSGFIDTISHQRDSWQGCRSLTDLALGLRYRQFFCCEMVLLSVALAWENHIIFNDNRFEDFVNRTYSPTAGDFPSPIVQSPRSPQFTRGDLCLQGLTLSARLEF